VRTVLLILILACITKCLVPSPILAADNVRDDPRYAPLDARLNKIYSAVRSKLSPAKKEELKQLELEFLNQREKLVNSPDAYFALTEKQIATLEQMQGGASNNTGRMPTAGNTKSSAPGGAVGTSPDGKYQVTRGKELVVGGFGTTPTTLQQNLNGDSDRSIKEILWSPAGDKVLITTAGDEGTTQVQIAWLRGTIWRSDFPPDVGNEPAHYLGAREKVLRWISEDVFEMTKVVILNSREPLPAVTFKVQIAGSGPKLLK
jgi:hypothetical protein